MENPFKETITELFFQKGSFPHFWYLGTLIILYLLLILLNHIINNKFRLIGVIYIVCFCLMILADGITIYRCNAGMCEFQKFVPQTFRIWTWIFYFLTFSKAIREAICKTRGEKLLEYVEKHCWAILASFIVLNLLYEYVIGYKMLGIILPEYFYDNIFMIVETILLFICFKKLEIRSTAARKVIKEISDNILGAYIIHLIIKRVALHIIITTSITGEIFLMILIFLLSIFATSIIRRISVMRWLVS